MDAHIDASGIEERAATDPEVGVGTPVPAGAAAAASGQEEPRSERRALADQLLEEITGWGPHDRVGVFRLWHRGALSLIHLNVLAVLEAEGPLPMNRLAEALDVSDASATGIVGRMEQRGLVERRHATDDRRMVLVHVAAAGTEVFQHIAQQRRERLARMLEELTDAELSGFLAGLRAMRAARNRLLAAYERDGLATGQRDGTAADERDGATRADDCAGER